ncbi:30S ribosomal protein S8 [Candidatus Gottesmanbacteria bacterium]|nr:30S ribosomal protein S8 [Candidatus Gottesmanbacteria bacterium]
MTTDTISDFLIRIKNGYMAHKKSVLVPYSKINYEMATILGKKGFIGSFKSEKKETSKMLAVELLYENGEPKMTNVSRVSKPGRRVYVKKTGIPRVLGGLGMVLISTPQGIFTGEDARKKSLGGELLCKLW